MRLRSAFAAVGLALDDVLHLVARDQHQAVAIDRRTTR
jgi:hypothetical protein